MTTPTPPPLVERLMAEAPHNTFGPGLREAAAHIAALEDHIAAQHRDMQQMATDFSAKLAALERGLTTGQEEIERLREHRNELVGILQLRDERIAGLETALQQQAAKCAVMVGALKDIAHSPHQKYEPATTSNYGIGVADGHRFCARIASDAITNLDSRAEKLIDENKAMKRLLEAIEADGMHRGDNYVGDCKVCVAVREARAALSATQDGKEDLGKEGRSDALR